jgi:hypothetical protein
MAGLLSELRQTGLSSHTFVYALFALLVAVLAVCEAENQLGSWTLDDVYSQSYWCIFGGRLSNKGTISYYWALLMLERHPSWLSCVLLTLIVARYARMEYI